MKIVALKAHSVRGIPANWSDLDVGDRGLIIYGPNGVGKSSIIDALEYTLSGKTTLFPRSIQGVTWNSAAPHVRDGKPTLKVQLNNHERSITLDPNNDETEKLAEEEISWITKARNANFVLRRHMLLRFITAQPKDRYDQLEPFMNLGVYADFEASLKNWKDRLETEYAHVEGHVNQLEGSLRNVFRLGNDQSFELNYLLTCLNEILQQIKIPKVVNIDDLSERYERISDRLGSETQNQNIDTIGRLKDEAQHLGTKDNIIPTLRKLIDATNDLENQIASKSDQVITDFLAQGKKAIENSSLLTCPLCEQSIDRDVLLARIDERIDADTHIIEARELVSKLRNALLQDLSPLVISFDNFIERWNQNLSTELPQNYINTASLLNEIKKSLDKNEFTFSELQEYMLRLQSSVSSHTHVITILEQLINDMGGRQQIQRLNWAYEMIKELLYSWSPYEQAIKDKTNIDKKFNVVNKLHSHAVEARKEAVRSVLEDNIQQLANQFYEFIHPGEGIAKSSLDIRDVGKGSINIKTDFYGKYGHPLLYYSESHLDTLGLCYFLALRRYEATIEPQFKVLVLDDVMHSVDADHRLRVANLISEQFSDHQIIITTHDVHFYDALYQNLGNNKYKYLRIHNWSLENGPITDDPSTDFAQIVNKEQRDKLSAEKLSSAGGRFFEWLLREVADSLNVSIQFSKRGYDIGKLWPPIAKRLKKQKGYYSQYQHIITGLEQNMWVRNQCGAHYNPTPSPPTESEVRDFAKKLSDLYYSLYCKECRRLVSQQSEHLWICPRGHIQYTKQGEA